MTETRQPTQGEVTRLLQAATSGDESAVADLWTAAQAEIRSMAGALVARENPSVNLQPTLVMNEAFIRLNPSGHDARQWQDRQHFFNCVWRVMRQFLIDHARSKQRLKRDEGRRPVTLEVIAGELTSLDVIPQDTETLITALDELEKTAPRAHEVLWRRMALNQAMNDIAISLDISTRAVSSDWRFARTWLRRALAEDES
jgi:RNA polymerase sigma factor (TIGR02999 family)